jgi:phosphoglycolate phosphatase
VRPSCEICDALGLSPFFFANYGGNSFSTKKPDPEGLLTIIREASEQFLDNNNPALASAEVVMIGDSDVDILTARRCGARTLACAYGLAPQTLAAAQPDLTAHHPEDWPTLLGL